MKPILFSAMLALGIGGCAHHDKTVEHHHHEQDPKKVSYDGQCAYSVAHEELGVAGKPEFSLEHAGLTYYFSSAEKLAEFKRDPHKNAERANRFWSRSKH